MRELVSRLYHEKRASAAAEMALVAPMLIILTFGAMEVGKYFYDEHIVAKAVRDGARYASRLSFSEYDCSTSTVSSDATTDVRNVTRTGQVTSGGTPRIDGWQDSDITVSVVCDTSGSYGGIYATSDPPVVTVSAAVDYQPILSTLGIDYSGAVLNARSQAAVMGL